MQLGFTWLLWICSTVVSCLAQEDTDIDSSGVLVSKIVGGLVGGAVAVAVIFLCCFQHLCPCGKQRQVTVNGKAYPLTTRPAGAGRRQGVAMTKSSRHLTVFPGGDSHPSHLHLGGFDHSIHHHGAFDHSSHHHGGFDHSSHHHGGFDHSSHHDFGCSDSGWGSSGGGGGGGDAGGCSSGGGGGCD